jgi:IS5 family transposase
MLRIYFLQLWFNLSDPAVEEALYDSVAMRAFAGIDLGSEGAPDETTVCKFRHLLERNQLGKVLLSAVNDHLHRSGIKISKGTIVDATIIGAPSSTKNKEGKRDPEMQQTAKGQQWYFGMKAHVGVDSRTKVIHTVLASAANVHDREALPHLLHGKETRVWADQRYQAQTKVIHRRAPRARDFTSVHGAAAIAPSVGGVSMQIAKDRI